MSFVHDGTPTTIKLPPLDRVGDSLDEYAVASCNCWDAAGEPVYYRIHAVDVTTFWDMDVQLPQAVLNQAPNAYKLLDEQTQKKLEDIVNASLPRALSAFEYWAALLRWVSGFHLICREYRAGSSSGWSNYLKEQQSEKSVWIGSTVVSMEKVYRLKPEEWLRVQSHAVASEQPPMHSFLLSDARHCMEVGDHRRALVDLSVACEVFLRSTVINSLPAGIQKSAVRLIEEANINQFISHLFPALLTDAANEHYKRWIRDELKSLVSKRNKLMHVAELEGANREACERYSKAVDALFLLELRS